MPARRAIVLTLSSIVVAIAAIAAPSALSAQRALRERQIVVSVLDRSGAPATGLAPADFIVREDDVAREVIRVEPATAPMQIVLLVDTSGGTQLLVPDIRKGLQSFARTVWSKVPDTEIALMEFGERPAQLNGFTRTADVLDRAVGRIFERSQSGAYLLEAILDAARLLKKKEATRPVIVAFDAESSTEFSPQTYREVEDALQGAHAALWAIELASSGGPGRSDEARNRNVVLGDVSKKSGGMNDTLLDRMMIDRRFLDLANRLTSQVAVTYARPESLSPPSRLEVSVKRDGMRVVAPHWTGQ